MEAIKLFAGLVVVSFTVESVTKLANSVEENKKEIERLDEFTERLRQNIGYLHSCLPEEFI